MANGQTAFGPRGLALPAEGEARHGELCLARGVRLARGRMHEVMGESADIFALAAAACAGGPVVWIAPQRDVASLSPTGLQAFVDPARLILVACGDRRELLWAGETALRDRLGPCVILELKDGPDLRESRRLQIAAEESGAIGLVIIHGRARTSASETRWQCDPGSEGGWDWVCTKNKRGRPAAWRASWRGEADAPDLVALVLPASA